ncbi:MAG: GDP-L-fucose synthase [Betaproteobacteria bacterium]|nr:GDP-L-fucose synthase [Betaproteobacteria bacterium]
MNPATRLYVAGHRGLVGSALVRALRGRGYTSIIARTHAELDLTDQQAVKAFFAAERPEVVCLAAAKVGGIMANNTYPAKFIQENLAIQNNVIDEARRAGVQRLLFLGSSCIYPRDCPQPIREDYVMTGPLEPTNRPYAMAKLAGLEMCWAYNRQYGTQYLCAMPTNLYGPGDNYDLETSHVLPALIRRFHEAKARGDKTVTLWGTGTPRREFLYSDDMAEACVQLLECPEDMLALLFPEDQAPLVNIGCGEDVTIRELALLIREVVGSDAEILWDRSKPDGTPRKLLDVSRLKQLGWRQTTMLRDGIALAYADFKSGFGGPGG